MNAKTRWRSLRSTAQQLEAVVWTYRTRTCNFTIDGLAGSDDGRVEKSLRDVLASVRRDLLKSANMTETALARAYPPAVYTHYQLASLPRGGAASEAALRRSSVLAYQLFSTHRCSAIVLPWAELEAAAAGSGGWDGVCVQLERMRKPGWTVIQGG